MKSYSRLNTVEQKKNIKRAKFYLILSIATLIALVVFGIPLLVKFAGFVGDIAKSNKPVDVQDITPPAPPHFEDTPDYTSKESLEVIGTSESGATIKIRANNNDYEVVCNSEGKFSFTFNLKKGENNIDAIAVDAAGNQSTQTPTYKIFFDNEEPQLEIEMPQDGGSFYGNSQKQITVKGLVNEKVEITINDRFVALKDDNSFAYSVALNEGSNEFKVKAIDEAGNETEKTLTVNFSF
jgi:hypothetical protein